MSIRNRIIIGFSTVTILFILAVVWSIISSGGLNSSATTDITTEEASQSLKITFSDDTETVMNGQQIRFAITLKNNSNKIIPGLRVIGIIDLDESQKNPNFFDQLINWMPDEKKSLAKNITIYEIGDFQPRTTKKYNIPYTVSRRSADQKSISSELRIYATTQDFSERGGLIGKKSEKSKTEIYRIDDIDKLIDHPLLNNNKFKCFKTWASCVPD